jgi:hypothetical protein
MEQKLSILTYITFKEFLIRRSFPELITINKKSVKKIEGKK